MENQRIRLSKAMLKSALLNLLSEKPLNQITVHEICRTAEINRTTFYKYYGSQFDLLEEIQKDFFTRLDENLKNIGSSNPDALLDVLKYLHTQRGTFCILVNAMPDRAFAEQLFSISAVGFLFKSRIDDHYSAMQAKYIKLFVFQGAYAIIRDWLSSREPEPAAEIAQILHALRDKLLP